jgi:pimeloyl-ACP methyl ester carboxylesterase
LAEYDNAKATLQSGISLPYHVEGTSRKNLLVLLHGLNAHSGTWRNNLPHLASSERKVIAPSLPHWPGPPPPDISEYTTDVHELIETFEPATISIAGNSMGGWIAMKLAKKFGSKPVKAIVLEDSAGTRKPLDEESLLSLDSLEIPVLIVWGKNDLIIPSVDADMLHKKIRNSELHVFPRTGHVPHWEKPEEFNKLVDDFLARSGV